MKFSPEVTVLLLVVLIGVLLFFALREVICWYYKINKMLEVQSKQAELQHKQIALLEQIAKSLSKEEDAEKAAE
jgi:hypothetical protein